MITGVLSSGSQVRQFLVVDCVWDEGKGGKNNDYISW